MIPGIDASDGLFSSANPYGSSQELDRTAFMQLLVSQLENQDPLDPIANENFVAQLANFSSLEQLESMNGNITAMIALNQSNAMLSQLTSGSALIGQEIAWIDPLTGEPGSGTVQSVKVIDGIPVLSTTEFEVPLAAVTEVLGDPDASDAPDEDDQNT